MDIKKIIANNLIELRKKNNLTQNDLAQKINYSDNAISRWEHGEVTPSIETLQQIADIFHVPLRSIIEDNAIEAQDYSFKKQQMNRLAIILISVSVVWLLAIITFIFAQMFFNYTFWTIFLWAVPVATLVMYPFHKYWGRHIYKFVILSIFLWTLITAIFLQCYSLKSWMWLIFILGVPIQVALAIWAFVKPKPKSDRRIKTKKEKKVKEKKKKEKMTKEQKQKAKQERKENKIKAKQAKKEKKQAKKNNRSKTTNKTQDTPINK